MTLEEAIAQIRTDPNRPRDATEDEIEHWARCAMAISSAVSAPLREEIERLDPPYVAALKVRVSKAAIMLRDALGLAEFSGPDQRRGIDDLAALAVKRLADAEKRGYDKGYAAALVDSGRGVFDLGGEAG